MFKGTSFVFVKITIITGGGWGLLGKVPRKANAEVISRKECSGKLKRKKKTLYNKINQFRSNYLSDVHWWEYIFFSLTVASELSVKNFRSPWTKKRQLIFGSCTCHWPYLIAGSSPRSMAQGELIDTSVSPRFIWGLKRKVDNRIPYFFVEKKK